MTDPAADAARAAAAILTPDLGPNLPAEVEAALAARAPGTARTGTSTCLACDRRDYLA